MSFLATFITREFLHGGHIQSVGAAAIVYTASVIFGLPVSALLLLLTYLLFQAIYYFDRYRDLEKDAETNRERTEHLSMYKKYIPALIIGELAVAAAVLAFSGTLAAILFATIITVFGLLYPTYFKIQTKRLPLFKNFYVSLVFALLIWFPFLYLGRPAIVSMVTVSLFIFVFAESLIAQLLLDLKDRGSDTRQGLRTLLMMVGRRQAHQYIVLLSVIVAVTSVIYGTVFSVLYQLIPLALLTLAFNLLVLKAISRGTHGSFALASAKYWLWPLVTMIR